MIKIEPMEVAVPDAVLADLRERLERIRWPQSFPEMGWDYGTNTEYMRELLDYWLHKFDWREQEARINQFPHFKADVDGIGVHFMHVEGKGPDPMHLFMMHGNPRSWATMLRIMPMLLVCSARRSGRATRTA